MRARARRRMLCSTPATTPVVAPQRHRSGKERIVAETIGVSELRAAGFTPAQIERLTALKALYPLCEFVVAREQLERLAFIKWLHANSGISL
jgi:hypothetical protein